MYQHFIPNYGSLIFHCTDTQHFVYLLISLRTFKLFPLFGYECCCYELLCRSFVWKSLSHVRLFVIPWTDYTVHGLLQDRIVEWVAVPFSSGSSQPRDQTQVSHIVADSLPAELLYIFSIFLCLYQGVELMGHLVTF